MNNIHDMGGMQGFGPVPIEIDEPVFHAHWHARALGITLAMAAHRRWSLDAMRHARERLAPASYLAMEYYERWLAALADKMVETGLIGAAELASGLPEGPPERPPLTAEGVMPMLARGGPTARDWPAPPCFRPGETVVTVNAHPAGHTRLPRYARGRRGQVVLHHGAHVFADLNAHGVEVAHHLYAVRFAARELWGPEAAERDSVTLDLWEPHLAVP